MDIKEKIKDYAKNEKDELFALMQYMIRHNAHHNDELKEIINRLNRPEVKAKVLEAVGLFAAGNQKLKEALDCLKEEK